MDNLLYAFWKDWIQDGGDTKCYLIIWSAPCLFRIVPHRTLSSVSFSLVIDIPRDKDSTDVLEILYSDPHYARPELNTSISPVSYVESYGYHAVNRHTGGRTRCPLKSVWAFSLASMSFGLGWQKKRAYIRWLWNQVSRSTSTLKMQHGHTIYSSIARHFSIYVQEGTLSRRRCNNIYHKEGFAFCCMIASIF